MDSAASLRVAVCIRNFESDSLDHRALLLSATPSVVEPALFYRRRSIENAMPFAVRITARLIVRIMWVVCSPYKVDAL